MKFSETKEGQEIINRIHNVERADKIVDDCFAAGQKARTDEATASYQEAFLAGAHWGDQDINAIEEHNAKIRAAAFEEVKKRGFWKEGTKTFVIDEREYPHDEECTGTMCWCANRAKKKLSQAKEKEVDKNATKDRGQR